MMLQNRARNGALAFTALAALALSAPAAHAVGTVSSSTTAPTTDAFDVFQPLFNDENNNLNDRDYSNATGTPGQRFTTGASTGQRLLSITIKGVLNQFSMGGVNGSGYADATTDNFGMRVSQFSGTTLGTTLIAETAPTFVSGASLIPDNYAGYVTFTFSTPVVLAANTTYSFDFFASDGYFATSRNPANTVGGGAFNTANKQNFNSNTATFPNPTYDRTFYANIAQVAAVPEPGTFALGLVGMVGFAPLAARRLRAARRK